MTSETSVAYVNGVSEAIFKVGMCLPAGPYVTDDDVRYIVETIKGNILWNLNDNLNIDLDLWVKQEM